MHDPNVHAFDIVQQTMGEKPKEQSAEQPVAKNPAAVSLGRLGGLRGGHARAAALSPSKRSDIAKKAAAKRWKREEPKA